MQYLVTCIYILQGQLENNHFHSGGNVFIKASDALEHLSVIFQYIFKYFFWFCVYYGYTNYTKNMFLFNISIIRIQNINIFEIKLRLSIF